jgi:hypothetical protein
VASRRWVPKPMTGTAVQQGVHTTTFSLATNVRWLAIDAGVDRIQFVAIYMLRTHLLF